MPIADRPPVRAEDSSLAERGLPSGGLSDGMVRRIYGNLGKLMGGKAVAGLVSLAYMVIALRALGVRDYGVLILVHTYTITVGGLTQRIGRDAVVRVCVL